MPSRCARGAKAGGRRWWGGRRAPLAGARRATHASPLRSALIGFCCSFVSDCVSNSVRVVKTAKQTSREAASYFAVASQIVAQDGIAGLLFRGLGTKLLSNGLQAMLFTVCWRYLEEKLNERAKRKLEEKKAE